MTRAELELERLATRIADDEPVNWRELDPLAPGEVAQTLSGLRELEQLAQGFRRVGVAGGERAQRQRLGQFRFGQLEAIERIGTGMQGEVWRAYDVLLDQSVALKMRRIESGELAHQFLEEARRLARVRHANIVSVYGAAIHDGRAGIWSELVTGESLAALLAAHGPLPLDEVRAIGVDLCHALAVVHRHGLVHGDIKPENVMRDHGGRIVLMDFGATREFLEAPAATVLGTPNYLAPEVWRGEAATPASDLYALGVLLYLLATGAYPAPIARDLTAPRSPSDATKSRALAATDSAAALTADFRRVLDRALDPDPQRRPANALAFAAALAPAPPAHRERHWLALGVAAVSILALVIAAARLYLAPSPWHTSVSFERIDATGATTLADGARLALGDRLALRFESSRPAYVYVFNDDGNGEAAVVFPLSGVVPGNPLAPDRTYRLPGSSGATALSWQVSSGATREEFIVLAADATQPELDQAIATWQRASAAAQTATRGALNLVPAPSDTEVGSAALRAVLNQLDAVPPAHLRRWRFVFPHAG